MLVAEIGLNHMGSETRLLNYIKSAKGVDAFTLQILSDKFYENKKYRSLELQPSSIVRFIDLALDMGYKVGLAVDCAQKVQEYNSDKISFYKVLSKEIGNESLIGEIYNTSAQDIYISTGMSGYAEIDSIFAKCLSKNDRVKLIHTQLSNDPHDVNLQAINVMRDKYNVPVAYGHHCKDLEVFYAATGLNPESIFFYIKGDDNIDYPDNAHAVPIKEVLGVVSKLRMLESAYGDGKKVSMRNWAK